MWSKFEALVEGRALPRSAVDALPIRPACQWSPPV